MKLYNVPKGVLYYRICRFSQYLAACHLKQNKTKPHSLILASAERIFDSQNLVSWLGTTGLEFNSFTADKYSYYLKLPEPHPGNF